MSNSSTTVSLNLYQRPRALPLKVKVKDKKTKEEDNYITENKVDMKNAKGSLLLAKYFSKYTLIE